MNELKAIEYQNKRVLTTKQLAEVYQTESKNIKMNFSNNIERFVEDRDYFVLQGNKLKEFKDCTNDIGLVGQRTSIMYLWTERGANRHSKILDTDNAWKQFDILEETYFKVKNELQFSLPQTFAQALLLASQQAELIERQEKMLLESKPKVEFFDAVADSKTAVPINEVAKVLNIKGMGRNNLFEYLRENKILMQNNMPYQKYIDCNYFRVVEQKYLKDGEQVITFKTLVYQRGVDYIRKMIESK